MPHFWDKSNLILSGVSHYWYNRIMATAKGKNLSITEKDLAVSEFLREAVNDAKITQRKLAELTGLSKSGIGRILTGRTNILLGELELICKALDLIDWQVIKTVSETMQEKKASEFTLAARRITPQEQQMLDEYNSFDS